jgi:hypothetical protein
MVVSKNEHQHHHQQQEPARHQDFFYKVLQERATAVLKEKGVDPVTHRGATPLRAAYYVLVGSCWIIAGYSHLKVRVRTYVRTYEL